MQATPINTIETAIVERLRLGLGKLVRSVESYGGEFDEDLATVVRSFPAAWVTFIGVLGTKPTSTSRKQYVVSGRFVVMVGQRSVRSESASRKGNDGSYQLVQAVRRLLANQDFGLDGVDHMQPGAVRTLFNGQTRSDAASVFACEFDVRWTESSLEPGRWPAPDLELVGTPGNNDPDEIFAENGGKLDVPYGDLERVKLDHRLPNTDAGSPPDATDIVILGSQEK